MNTASSLTIVNDWMNAHPLLGMLIIIWSLVWKGFALWRSAGLRQKYWFMIILVVNTLGLLDIFYLFIIARKYKVEVVEN